MVTGCESSQREEAPCPDPHFEKVLEDCMKILPEPKRRMGIAGLEGWSNEESGKIFKCMGIDFENMKNVPNYGE